MIVTLGAIFGLHYLIDPDLFLHITVGHDILAHPGSIGVSHFIEAHPSFPYVEDKWLACVLVALAHAIAGLDGVMGYQIALCVAVVSLDRIVGP